MNKIKIGYFADGPWSHLAFEKIIKDPCIEVKFIVPRNDTKDETLKNYSTKYKIDKWIRLRCLFYFINYVNNTKPITESNIKNPCFF